MFLFIQRQVGLEATGISCEEADKPNAMCLCVSRSILSLPHCSAENIWGIAQKVPTLADKMHSKYFQAWWLLLHLVKIFGNVAVVLMDFPNHTAHFWMDYPSGSLSC